MPRRSRTDTRSWRGWDASVRRRRWVGRSSTGAALMPPPSVPPWQRGGWRGEAREAGGCRPEAVGSPRRPQENAGRGGRLGRRLLVQEETGVPCSRPDGRPNAARGFKPCCYPHFGVPRLASREGRRDNSPAFQCWEGVVPSHESPVGTAEHLSAVPTGLTNAPGPYPGDESLGYSHAVPPARMPLSNTGHWRGAGKLWVTARLQGPGNYRVPSGRVSAW